MLFILHTLLYWYLKLALYFWLVVTCIYLDILQNTRPIWRIGHACNLHGQSYYHTLFNQFGVPVSCRLVRPVPCILLLDLFHSSQGDIFFVEAPGLSSRFDGKVKRNLGDLEFEERLEAVRRYEYVFA